jgi:hypothetical protein
MIFRTKLLFLLPALFLFFPDCDDKLQSPQLSKLTYQCLEELDDEKLLINSFLRAEKTLIK